MAIATKIRAAWNAFVSNDTVSQTTDYIGGTVTQSSSSPSRVRRRYANERTIITSICTRIAIDVADVPIRHVQTDAAEQYQNDIDSNLNLCMTLEPNLDQAPRAFRQDIVMTLLDEGVAAIVPVDTTRDPQSDDNIDIYTMRVGIIKGWLPNHVRVSVYNQKKGQRQEITLEKRSIAIVENPLYSVMNEPNSTYQRLLRKLSLLDTVDEQTSSGKLDIIIQLPYQIKTEARKQQAEQRRTSIEDQLKDTKYGIAYTDATEKITQLNRPAENNLLKQVEMLTDMLYDQLGVTKDVLAGTANEATMTNYHNRTIKPILEAVVEAMQRTFIGQARTKKGERMFYFRDPFKLIPISQLAEIGDKFTRNEILSSNELRGYIGIKPSQDPKADELRNSNMPRKYTDPTPPGLSFEDVDGVMNEVLDKISSDIDKIAGGK